MVNMAVTAAFSLVEGDLVRESWLSDERNLKKLKVIIFN